MSGKSTLLRTVGVTRCSRWRGAGAGPAAPRVAAGGRRHAASPGFAAGRQVALLRRDHAAAAACGLVDRRHAAAVPARRAASGTNSHDRPIGAEAISRASWNAAPIGLVTTHDLALADIAERLAPHAANVHFEDHVEDGQISSTTRCGREWSRRATRSS